LAAARRPTVTGAISELSRRGLVHQVDDGWQLLGNPPGELLELVSVPSSLTHGERGGPSADEPSALDGPSPDGPSADEPSADEPPGAGSEA
ncbi:MAG TPA: hypothetical protein VL972_07550, partial [Solirubrobacteraceae bacterium]|nr:hypothetical protein [Solirubrobacteraceae bacterium]